MCQTTASGLAGWEESKRNSRVSIEWVMLTESVTEFNFNQSRGDSETETLRR